MPEPPQPPERQSAEVFVACGDLVTLGPGDVSFLRERLADAPRRRVRICTHGDPGDRLQEMIILLDRSTFVRPHRHLGKVESFHVIEGEADAVFFDDAGAVTAVVALGDSRSGRAFYCRITDCGYHTLLLRSPTLLLHEATTGPFRPEETLGAPWSPAEGDAPGIERFCGRVEELVRRFRERRPEP